MMNIEKIMEQAQVFASAWSVVGGPFDGGDAMEVATQEKDELRRMVEESKLEEPAFGIIDPDYARIYTQARIVAWSHGYSCCAQGSFTRDLDLLLVPWAPEAKESANHANGSVDPGVDIVAYRIVSTPDSKPSPLGD